jgi:hypothetical protein
MKRTIIEIGLATMGLSEAGRNLSTVSNSSRCTIKGDSGLTLGHSVPVDVGVSVRIIAHVSLWLKWGGFLVSTKGDSPLDLWFTLCGTCGKFTGRAGTREGRRVGAELDGSVDHGSSKFDALFIFLWYPDFASGSISGEIRKGDAVDADEGDVLGARGNSPVGRGIDPSGTEGDALGGIALTLGPRISLKVGTGAGIRGVGLPEGNRLFLVRHGENPFAVSALSRLM